MIGSNYKIHRDNVIDLYEGYIRKRKEFEAAMGSREGDGVDLNFLKSRIDNLKNSKFTLAVAGEVKAGKSTFINALLGTELLPSDVLQATSAIVEIFKSDTSYLNVKYADGHTEKVYDDPSTPDIDEAREYLEKISKISDEFRDIPTTLIDQFIAEQDAEISKVEDIPDELIERWESESHLKLLDKKERIYNYIKLRPKSAIPVEIQFGYPLKWNFDELRLVDTPGVNAIGGVQDRSFSCLESANAILFVHRIEPVESESFIKFVERNISNRSRESLFLILTHAANYTQEDAERLYNEAKRIYSQYIPEDRILVVDSVLQLILNDFNNGKTREQIEEESEQKADLLAKFERRAKKAGKTLIEMLEYSSGFKKMYETIDKFAMEAPNLQLREILDAIKRGYEKQEEEYNAKIGLLEMKRRDPQEFENEINRIKHELEEYKNLLNMTKEDIKNNYTGTNSKWEKRINELKAKHPQKISNSKYFETVRKSVMDAYNEIYDIINQYSSELTKEFDARLQEAGETFKKEHKITLPKVDLDAIENETKKKAFIKVGVYEYRPWDFWDVITGGFARLFRENKVKKEEIKVYDKKLHLDTFKIYCQKEVYSLVNDLWSIFKDILNNYLNSFSDKVNKVIKERKKALDKELQKKEENEEIISKMHDLAKKKEGIQQEIERVEEVLEDIV